MSIRELTFKTRFALYPAIEPFAQGLLAVGDGHTLYFEQSGNPKGEPVLVVHGGPGGGSNATMRRFHDPRHYRIVLFDQRGCGRSTPNASIAANSTWHLVDDIERLRRQLGIERCQLFGGSWGSTLSLAYAQSHPERVTAMILRGIFLLRRRELDWFYQDGCNWLFPDAYAEFARLIPEAERGDMIGGYYKRLTNPDPRVYVEAARAWSIWEGSTLALVPDAERIRLFGLERYAVAFARIECHYFAHGGFLEQDDQLIRDVGRLGGIPARIVHGRYDVVTPLRSAWELARAWPGAELRIVGDAGHAMTEAGIIHELITATREMARTA